MDTKFPVDKFGRVIVTGCFLVGAWRHGSAHGLRLWRVVEVDADGHVWVIRRTDYRDGVTRRTRLAQPTHTIVFDNPPLLERLLLEGA